MVDRPVIRLAIENFEFFPVGGSHAYNPTIRKGHGSTLNVERGMSQKIKTEELKELEWGSTDSNYEWGGWMRGFGVTRSETGVERISCRVDESV